MSEPGRSGRCRSAMSAVSVKRGSATMTADALPGHGMALGGVGPDQEEAVGDLDVGIGAGRAVGPQRARVAGRGRGHAEARVRVEVVRAEKALGQLRGDVVLLGQELSRAVEGDRRGTVRGHDLAKPVRDHAHGQLPRHAGQLGVTPRPHLRIEEPIRRPEGRRQVHGLGAHIAKARRVLRIPLHPLHHAVLDLHQQSAPNSAVGAERLPPASTRRGHSRALRGSRRPGRAARSTRRWPGSPPAGAAGGNARTGSRRRWRRGHSSS
jgi:hypothetical protein